MHLLVYINRSQMHLEHLECRRLLEGIRYLGKSTLAFGLGFRVQLRLCHFGCKPCRQNTITLCLETNPGPWEQIRRCPSSQGSFRTSVGSSSSQLVSKQSYKPLPSGTNTLPLTSTCHPDDYTQVPLHLYRMSCVLLRPLAATALRNWRLEKATSGSMVNVRSSLTTADPRRQ